MSMEEFADFLTTATQKYFSLTYLFPWQRLVISNILEGAGYFGSPNRKDDEIFTENTDLHFSPEPTDICADIPHRQVAILPTGAGKSLCFMLPGVLLEGITVILFPLLSLMSDQKRRLDEQEIPAELLRGGQNRKEREAAWQRLENSPEDGQNPDMKRPRFLLSNPETLIQPAALRRLSSLPIDHLVIDEAHTVPMWGREFRPALTRIPEIIDAIRPKMTSAFTATASDSVLAGIQEILFPNEPAHVIRANPDRPNISYNVIPVLSKRRELRRLLARIIPARQMPAAAYPGCGINLCQNQGSEQEIEHKPPNSLKNHNPDPNQQPNPDTHFCPNPLRVPRPALIFCPTRAIAEQTAARLRRDLGEDEIFFYHAGLEREEKKQIEEWFFGSSNGILTATTAYGMGVDKSNIRTVIHHSPSRSVEAFLQESGRAGRDGGPSYSIVLVPWTGRGSERTMELDRNQRQSALLSILQEREQCLRKGLLSAMGSPCEMCWGCDICDKSRPVLPEGFREIMLFFRKNRYRFTIPQASELIQGADAVRVRRGLLPPVPGTGGLSHWSRDEIEKAISVLIRRGALKKPRRGFRRGLVGIDLRIERAILPISFPHLLRTRRH